MAKAIIHNSNYHSVDECKIAIDRYFAERNAEKKDTVKQPSEKSERPKTRARKNKQ